MTTFPKVIGFVPAYNSEKFIRPTLEALAAQNYPNLEVIICDDASKDGTFAICQEFVTKNPNFTLIRNPENLGWFQSSESLWTKAAKESKYCFINPHDDLPFPDYVSELVGLLEENSNAVNAIPGMKNLYPDGKIKNSFFSEASGNIDTPSRAIKVAKRDINYWWAAYHGLHRSTAVAKILPVAKLPFGEKEFSADLVWTVKMALLGQFVTSKSILFQKNYLNKSLSATWSHNSINKTALWIAILKEFHLAKMSSVEKKRLWKEVGALFIQKIKLRLTLT